MPGRFLGIACVARVRHCTRKPEGAVVVLDQGHQFQKAFVDASQVLGAHVAPPDGHRASTRPYPGQLVDRVVEAVVGDIRGIEVRTPVGREDPTEGGQPQGRPNLGCKATRKEKGLRLVYSSQSGQGSGSDCCRQGQSLRSQGLPPGGGR